MSAAKDLRHVLETGLDVEIARLIAKEWSTLVFFESAAVVFLEESAAGRSLGD